MRRAWKIESNSGSSIWLSSKDWGIYFARFPTEDFVDEVRPRRGADVFQLIGAVRCHQQNQVITMPLLGELWISLGFGHQTWLIFSPCLDVHDGHVPMKSSRSAVPGCPARAAEVWPGPGRMSHSIAHSSANMIEHVCSHGDSFIDFIVDHK